MGIRIIEREIDNQLVTVHIIPALKDNYIYLLEWGKEGIVIDAATATDVLNILEEKEIDLKAILTTHHHKDHIGGNSQIKAKTECRIIGPSDVHIELIDQVVSDGEEIIMGPILIQVIMTVGHTLDHLCYYLPDYKILFSGDTLFSSGCGRVFEGTAKQLFASLQILAKLPKETLVLCGHEYTLANLKFARSVDPENKEIDKRIEEVEKLGFGVPSTLEMELKTNPFLRTENTSIRKHLGMERATDEEIFCKLMEKKGSFV